MPQEIASASWFGKCAKCILEYVGDRGVWYCGVGCQCKTGFPSKPTQSCLCHSHLNFSLAKWKWGRTVLVKVFPSKFSCFSLKNCFNFYPLLGKMGKKLIFFSCSLRIFGVGEEENSKEEEFTARGKIPSNMWLNQKNKGIIVASNLVFSPLKILFSSCFRKLVFTWTCAVWR